MEIEREKEVVRRRRRRREGEKGTASYFQFVFSCPSFHVYLSSYFLSRRLEVAANKLLNRLEFMDKHHEHDFASASDNIADIYVR